MFMNYTCKLELMLAADSVKSATALCFRYMHFYICCFNITETACGFLCLIFV